MSVQRALLVIADISGYTRFMKVHRINLAHAQDIVGRLLEAVIDGARPRLKLSKLEGDAALFYAPLTERDDLVALSEQIAKVRRAFVARRDQMVIDQLCNCDGCTQVGELKIKFVAHVGDVAIQKIKSFRELAGLDVILVHRMLKNSVPVREYVLMTEPVLGGLSETVRAFARPIDEDFEGVGPTRVHYVDLDEIARVMPHKLEPSKLRAIWELVKMNARSLLYILGFKKACAVFHNMDEALGRLPPPPPLPSLPPHALVTPSSAEDLGER